MSIILPDFKGRKCVDASLCGFMPVAEYPNKDQLSPCEESLVAEYEKSGCKVFMRLVPPFPGADDEDIHVHLDLSVADSWKKPPLVTSTPDAILARFAPLVGKKTRLTLRGRFRVPIAALPPFIYVTLGESIVNDVQVRMTEGTLKVRGAPIQEIGWRLLEKEGAVEILLVARTEDRLEDSYLVKGLDLLESAFVAFVVGAAQ